MKMTVAIGVAMALAMGALGPMANAEKGKGEALPGTAPGASQGAYTGKPYGGAAREIPGVIQAEAYDVAPQGANDVTFHYQGGAKKGEFRSDGIGVAKFGKGHVNTKGEAEDEKQVYLGWTQTGQWMKYSVKVAEAGTYKVGGKFAVAGKDAKLAVAFSAGGKAGETPAVRAGVPTTAGFVPGVEVYHVWETVEDLGEIKLETGEYVMTVTIENAGGINVDYFSLTRKK